MLLHVAVWPAIWRLSAAIFRISTRYATYRPNIMVIYVKNCSVYIQCKGDIVVVDIKQHKSQFKNSNFTITQSAKFF